MEKPILPLKLEKYDIHQGYYPVITNCNGSDLSDEQFKWICHAAENHDAPVERIAELEEFVRMVANGETNDHDAAIVHTQIHAREARKLLGQPK